MSKEHYVPPKTFYKLMDGKELKRIGLSVDVGDEEFAKYIIDNIRKFNKQDPGFKYSCECDETEVVWSFGYTIPEIYDLVDRTMDELIMKYQENNGENPEVYHSHTPFYASACSCPFDM